MIEEKTIKTKAFKQDGFIHEPKRDNDELTDLGNTFNAVFTMEDKEAHKLQVENSKRVFASGASRNSDQGKLDFDGFLSVLVTKSYAEYLEANRVMEDGSIRASDNWQKGIPVEQYMKSMWRHFFDVWSTHRGYPTKENQIKNLNALKFNVDGMLHELLKAEHEQK